MSDHPALCPFCGAYSPRSCELEEETGGMCPWEETGGMCPWEEILEDEPDPDLLREQRDDMRRLFGFALRSLLRDDRYDD